MLVSSFSTFPTCCLQKLLIWTRSSLNFCVCVWQSLTSHILFNSYFFNTVICDPSCEKGPYGNYKKYRPWTTWRVWLRSELFCISRFSVYWVIILPQYTVTLTLSNRMGLSLPQSRFFLSYLGSSDKVPFLLDGSHLNHGEFVISNCFPFRQI